MKADGTLSGTAARVLGALQLRAAEERTTDLTLHVRDLAAAIGRTPRTARRGLAELDDLAMIDRTYAGGEECGRGAKVLTVHLNRTAPRGLAPLGEEVSA